MAPSHGLAYLRLPPPQTPANMEGVGFLEAGGAGSRHRMLLMPRYRDIAISRFFYEDAASTGRQLPVRCRRRWIGARPALSSVRSFGGAAVNKNGDGDKIAAVRRLRRRYCRCCGGRR